jgi:mono/diheme cytochrome c family protein
MPPASHKHHRSGTRASLAAILVGLAWSRLLLPAAAADDQLFENQIRPVLVDVCFACHGNNKVSGGLQVDRRAALLAGGDSGPAIVPGQPAESLLLHAIARHEDVSPMPPDRERALRPEQVAAFERWILAGAPWPESSAPLERTAHWALAPISNPPLPEVRQREWVRESVDAFILARLEQAGVQPAPEADRRTLIRRATYDLTGLPPTPHEVDEFLRDDASDAYGQLIERLLQSPAYGERWGRHWLDVVRYADTAGETADYPLPEAWRYRNYVIAAFNNDLPYDQFLREQIAGDILARSAPGPRYAEQVIATGFLALSRRFGFDSENYHHLTIQDSIDTLGQTILGLSLGCARCHDHKFDDVPMRDYYALYGIFDSSRYAFPGSEQKQKFRTLAPLLPPPVASAKWREFEQQLNTVAAHLQPHNQSLPAVILRPLSDIDGDFELQAPAAGGSNGVLVPPWLYEGSIAVTTSAQSPFQNRYARGRVGAAIPAGAAYRIEQALYLPEIPSDGSLDAANEQGRSAAPVRINLDFRTLVDAPTGAVGHADPQENRANASPDGTPETGNATQPAHHRHDHNFQLLASDHSAIATISITPQCVRVQLGDSNPDNNLINGDSERRLSVDSVRRNEAYGNYVDCDTLIPGCWHNLQLEIAADRQSATCTISVLRADGELHTFPSLHVTGQVSSERALRTPHRVILDSSTPADPGRCGIEYDNLAVQYHPLAPAATQPSTDTPFSQAATPQLVAQITDELQQLAGMDSDFELHTAGQPPSSPWNTGPNSVVTATEAAQSPYVNIFPAGKLGLRMPNRVQYDGFGLTLPQPWTADSAEQLHAAFDFRLADVSAGGQGSWRFYLGQGPGNSAAVELFFNGDQFFYRSGDAREAVAELEVNQWYQVQLTLDLKQRKYSGSIASAHASPEALNRTEFSGDVAAGWNGTLDYSFIDSYGHLPGVRPELHVDNYVVRPEPLPDFTDASVAVVPAGWAERQQQIQDLRRRLRDMQAERVRAEEDANRLLASGPYAMAYAVTEGTPHDARMQLRGEPDQPGESVPRGFLTLLGGAPLPETTLGSGRLELAQWLTRADNPLTARVMVNRIWQHHFGAGLVTTPNDFGVRGQPPTHPELLDHLATQFIHHGWSIKALHRTIMCSATYRQSSLAVQTSAEQTSAVQTSAVQASDVQTLAVQASAVQEASSSAGLLGKFPRRRLSAEEIRDAILAVSGQLDREPGTGHPFPSPLGWGFSQHGPFLANYEHEKRSVYLMTQRIKRHPFLALFDGPDPNASTATRLRTTVPTQALFFLNSPFVHSAALAWARQLAEQHPHPEQQIDHAVRAAWGRPASDSEQLEAAEFLQAYRQELNTADSESTPDVALAAWLRTLLASNEFLHVD